MTRIPARLPAAFLTLSLVLPACAAESADPDVVVRRASVDGDVTHAEVEIDGAMRHLLVLERDDGERVIAVSDAAWQLRAIVLTDGDAEIDFDPASGLGTPLRCTGACAPVDAASADLVALVIADALAFDASAEAWRENASQAEKRLNDHREELRKNWAP